MDTPLQIAICEDNPSDAKLLISYIMESGIACRWEVFTSGEALLEAFRPGNFNLIFLDIYLEGIKGVDAASEIRKADRTVMLSFTTTSTDHALESYRLRATSYLEKPIKQEDVMETISLALVKRNTAAYITLLIGGTKKNLAVDSILYFELQNHAIMVHTHTEILRTSQTVKLNHIKPMLPEHFLRCHHSYLINLHYVKEIDKEFAVFIMQNNDRVHIRRRDLQKSIKAYEDYLFTTVTTGK